MLLYSSFDIYGLLWTPAEMTTTLWLDAADSSTVTTVSGTVSEWEDKKNNGLILTTFNRPLYNASLNNLNVITFVRSSQHFLRTASFPTTGWSNLLVFVVTKWTTINSNSTTDIQVIIDNNHGGTTQGFVLQDRPDLSGDPLTYSRHPPLSNGAEDNTSPGDNTWKMYCGYSSATFDRLYRDGEVVSELANTEAFNFTNILNVGRWEGGGGSRYLEGDIAEIVISQDTTAIDKVFGYLAHKWGLTANLPVTHPYKNTPPYV